ncbi:AmmeMemoRadiSam system protein B [Thermodesulfobacteriota bacterium]
MNDTAPKIRKDLEFFPVQHEGRQLILIRDQTGLVPEGKAVAVQLYQIMALLDGTRSLRDLQMELMRQRGGLLVGTNEIQEILAYLDDSFLLDSERFRAARDDVVARFSAMKVRPCAHCGKAYPNDPMELRGRLDNILSEQSPPPSEPEGKIQALVAPHIDLTAGFKVYSRVYQMLKYIQPARVILLGVGHHMSGDLFSLTNKDFETPMGAIKSDPATVKRLIEKGRGAIAADDFEHRSEHSIEFQTIFLRHILKKDSFTIVPILCGSLHACLPEYSRDAYLAKAGPFLKELREIVMDPEKNTLLMAGVDFSHIGPKFGHEMPAEYLENQSEPHDRRLLKYLSVLDADCFWEESIKVNDRFNVCGFSALACLLEVIPSCRGEVLDYQVWHEEATRSAVGFAGVVFTS